MIAILHLIFPFVQQIRGYKDKYDDWDEVDVGVDGQAIGIRSNMDWALMYVATNMFQAVEEHVGDDGGLCSKLAMSTWVMVGWLVG
jgi:hypothetical protein